MPYLHAPNPIDYEASKIENLLVNNLYQKAARNCQLYLICSVLFIFGGMLSNLEGIIYEKFDDGNQENIQYVTGVQNTQFVSVQNTQFVPGVQNTQIIENCQNNEDTKNTDKPNFIKKIIHEISKFGFIYHSGSAILAVLAFFMPILNVVLLKYWSSANSVNTLRPASSANNMVLASPVYLFFLLISLLPLVAYSVTVCSVPCGTVKQQTTNNNLNQNYNNQFMQQGQNLAF